MKKDKDKNKTVKYELSWVSKSSVFSNGLVLRDGNYGEEKWIPFKSCSGDNYNVRLVTQYLFEKTCGYSTEFCKKIINIEKNDKEIIDQLSKDDYEIVVHEIFKSRNNHFIPQMFLSLWTAKKTSYLVDFIATDGAKEYSERKTSNTLKMFTKEDGYIFTHKNELITIEDGFINYIEKHIKSIKDYLPKIKQSFVFDCQNLIHHKDFLNNLSILFYYTCLINNRFNIDKVFIDIMNETRCLKSYEAFNKYLFNKTLNFLLSFFKDKSFWGVKIISDNVDDSFLLTDRWMLELSPTRDKRSTSLVIPLSPKIAFILSDNLTDFECLYHNLDISIKDLNISAIERCRAVDHDTLILTHDTYMKDFILNFLDILKNSIKQ